MEAYLALFEPDREAGHVVTCPDLGYGATQGETAEKRWKWPGIF